MRQVLGPGAVSRHFPGCHRDILTPRLYGRVLQSIASPVNPAHHLLLCRVMMALQGEATADGERWRLSVAGLWRAGVEYSACNQIIIRLHCGIFWGWRRLGSAMPGLYTVSPASLVAT